VSIPCEQPDTALWAARRDGPVLRITGTLDAATADAVAERLGSEIRAGTEQLDLSGVDFCGAAGVRALLSALDASRARGHVLRLRCPPMVMRVMDQCGVTDADGWQVVSMTPDRGDGRPV
jgi:anti-anti-sigma factor